MSVRVLRARSLCLPTCAWLWRRAGRALAVVAAAASSPTSGFTGSATPGQLAARWLATRSLKNLEMVCRNPLRAASSWQ